ncbi:MAG: hypothetical protein ABIR28_15050, partial [Vicinamibacteria bacterium]
ALAVSEALKVAGETWNVSSLVGMIGVSGIAVQNSLVLVTQTWTHRRMAKLMKGESRREKPAGTPRFRSGIRVCASGVGCQE